MEIRINTDDDGKTLLTVLRQSLGFSNAFIRHLKFSDGGITVNGEHQTVRYIVRDGDILTLRTDDTPAANQVQPVSLPLDIIYEDDDVVVPNKPPFMPTHPSHGHYDDTLANALAFRYGAYNTPYVFRPVNRLDRNTSGAVIVARNRLAASKLAEAMKCGLISKTYLAVLDGIPPQESGKIETYLRRTAQSIIVREVCDCEPGADYALTNYRVLAVSKYGKSLIEAIPQTGRTHQLRVHFASIGCSITGDDLYGEASQEINRHALHAYGISFPRPSDGETVTLTAPLFDDISTLISRFFGNSISIANRK